MSDAWDTVDDVIQAGIPHITPAAVLCVVRDGVAVIERAHGRLSPEPGAPAAMFDTVFDLASITKIYTTTLFLQLVDEGRVTLQTPVAAVLRDLAGVRPLGGFEHPLTGELVTYPYPPQPVDARCVTFEHLLTHTSGLADWLPLYREPERAAAIQRIYDHPFAYPPGARIAYSDLGFILLGEAIERLLAHPLAEVLRQRLLLPLEAASIQYRPVPEDGSPPERLVETGKVAPTEVCRWRKRRLQGEVDDENAGRLGGIAGHAGLFGTARDVARLGELYLDGGVYNGRRLLREQTVCEATRARVHYDGTRRGLGWVVWSGSPGEQRVTFGPKTYGHTGFTGGSLWIDPDRALVYVLLTNRIYHGRAQDFAVAAHYQAMCRSAILQVLDMDRCHQISGTD